MQRARLRVAVQDAQRVQVVEHAEVQRGHVLLLALPQSTHASQEDHLSIKHEYCSTKLFSESRAY